MKPVSVSPKVIIITKKQRIQGALEDIEKMYKEVIKKAEKKYGVDLSDFSDFKELRELIRLMKNRGIKKIETDINGIINSTGLEELSELLESAAWSIECILTKDFVSDVYVKPVCYKIEIKDDIVVIKHNTVWINA